MRFFWGGHFEFFKSAILIFFFCFTFVKNPDLLYEVWIFSALWMVFPESWKRSCPNFYAHDCNPMANLWNFHKKKMRIGDFEKCPFWKMIHLGFCLKKYISCLDLKRSYPNSLGFDFYNKSKCTNFFNPSFK